MTILNAEQSDIQVLKDMHRKMEMTYQFPDHFDELTVIKRVVKDTKENIVAGATVKIIGEAYIFLDPGLSTSGKVFAIRALDRHVYKDAKDKGFSQVSIWVPPNVPGNFSKFLEDLGWRKSPWPTWTRNIR